MASHPTEAHCNVGIWDGSCRRGQRFRARPPAAAVNCALFARQDFNRLWGSILGISLATEMRRGIRPKMETLESSDWTGAGASGPVQLTACVAMPCMESQLALFRKRSLWKREETPGRMGARMSHAATDDTGRPPPSRSCMPLALRTMRLTSGPTPVLCWVGGPRLCGAALPTVDGGGTAVPCHRRTVVHHPAVPIRHGWVVAPWHRIRRRSAKTLQFTVGARGQRCTQQEK